MHFGVTAFTALTGAMDAHEHTNIFPSLTTVAIFSYTACTVVYPRNVSQDTYCTSRTRHRIGASPYLRCVFGR